MGISTHTKGLTNRTAKVSSGIVNKIKQSCSFIGKFFLASKDKFKKLVHNTPKKIIGIKKSLVVIFRRPLSDISHLSIILVIILALFSGFSTFSLGSANVSSNVLHPASQSATQYVSADEKRILEADLVTTLATIHSEKLGSDAFAVTLNLYQQQTSVSGNLTSISTIPVLAPATSASEAGKVTKYIVQNGDTLSQIANKFGISADTIRYANSLEDEDSIKPGAELTILPVSGILYTTKAGDTVQSVSSAYNLNVDQVIAKNDLYGVDLTEGMQLILPDAEIPAAPVKETAVDDSTTDDNSSNISYVKTSSGPNHFYAGQCTWWVAQKRYVPWLGDAWQWYGNAQSYGRPVGQKPIPGAIMVTWESGYGHVAYVESVKGNSFTVSEMNYIGPYVVSTRTITTSQVPLIGFIY